MSEIKRRIVYLLKRTDKRDDGTDIYVGSTSKTLASRLKDHRGETQRTNRNNNNNKLYRRMRDIGLDNWEVLPLLVLTCDRKTILGFEKEWSKALDADLNTYSPINTEQDNKEYRANYRESNKEHIKQQKASYYTLNKGHIIQRRAQYRQSVIQSKIHHCDVCDKSFTFNVNLQRHLDSSKHKYAHLYSWIVTL